MVELRLPNIKGENNTEKLAALQSYLYQLVGQLNWALGTLTAASENVQTVTAVKTGSSLAKTDAEAAQSFNQIKSLIIKSADIVNAYYQTINRRLQGEYVALSDYGSFKETTENNITANSTGITQLLTDVQTLGAGMQQLLTTNAWIRTGLLDYGEGGVPIYGFEVGQTTGTGSEAVFDKYARFTAGGIYFYLPGVTDAVAWMTGTKLYITNAEITGSIKLGSYSTDLASGIAFKWDGGD